MDTNQPILMGSAQNRGPAAMPVPPKPPAPKKMPEPAAPKKGMNWVYVAVGLLVLAGLWYLFAGKPTAVQAPAEEGAAIEEAGESDMGAVTGSQPSFLWEFAPAGGDAVTGAPRTAVTLSINGDTRSIGTFNGSCLVINGSSWTLAENELTGIICWFAGGGDEVGVFYENGAYVVKRGVVEEGTEGESGLRGNYETLFTI